ncbi:hypothetical protein Tco_0910270 [Tanacetum coccineum]|uniref:Uncharacterized protein n=1 Tax=Tanacetum coccineum TaxID=301880 RepID=A0ABQ5CTM0_9ASTR
MLKETPYELLKDEQKKQLGKNNDTNMTLYSALPHKEYERIFMYQTTKEVWHTLIITHQGNSQVKDCKIDLLTQQYEKSAEMSKTGQGKANIDKESLRRSQIRTLKQEQISYAEAIRLEEQIMRNKELIFLEMAEIARHGMKNTGKEQWISNRLQRRLGLKFLNIDILLLQMKPKTHCPS